MKTICLLATLISLMAAPLAAGVLEPVRLEEIQHSEAELVVSHPDGTEAHYSPAELELFPTFRLETTTPWRTEAAVFEGVRLKDVLNANGLSEAGAISVVAENEYTVSIPGIAWQELDIMVATRVNGAPISRRERGPIQFVVDMDAYQASSIAREDYLVWMAARIAPEQ